MHVLEAALIANALNKKARGAEQGELQPGEPRRPFYRRWSVRALSVLVALAAVVTLLEIAAAGAPTQAQFTLIASHAG